MRDVDFTVLLPCAGKGSRFGAPYPKELHRVSADRSLVDLALGPALDLARTGARVRLVVTLAPGKLTTADYLSSYAEHFELVFTFQDGRHGSELPGALRAAAPLCAGPTVLLLPDQHFAWTAEDNAIRWALAHLARHPWVLIAALTDDRALLRADGAVSVDLGHSPARAVRIADKPADPTGYNAVWAAVVCGAAQVERLPTVVADGGANTLAGAPTVLVHGYRNMSTPETGAT